MRVLDLGCGRALSSVFLRREFGVQVWATDLWFSASENLQRVRDAGVEDGVFPIHADARSLPFAAEFFDAIVSIDSFVYYGTDDLYLNYLARFVKPGGPIGIAGAGLMREIDGPVPDHLREWWTAGPVVPALGGWWRRHWERTGILDVEVADTLPDGWRLWLRLAPGGRAGQRGGDRGAGGRPRAATSATSGPSAAAGRASSWRSRSCRSRAIQRRVRYSAAAPVPYPSPHLHGAARTVKLVRAPRAACAGEQSVRPQEAEVAKTISTRALGSLPDIDGLRRLLQSLAMLDAILSPGWDSRYYSFNARWSRGEQMGSMRNGQGDDLFALFDGAGCFLKGFAHEAPMSPYRRRPKQVWPGVLDAVPPQFAGGLSEPAFSIEDATFCIWRRYGDASWQVGPIEFPAGADPDGSELLLSPLDGDPETYATWAESYYRRPVHRAAVGQVYAHRRLTEVLVRQLNPKTSLERLAADRKEIGYPGRGRAEPGAAVDRGGV